MNELKDTKLKMMLQNIKLESPNANFPERVMDKILQENEALEKIKAERILGKGFWIILILFIILLGLVGVVSSPGTEAGGIFDKLFQTNKFLGGAGDTATNYKSLLEKFGSLPVGVSAILIATSILLFIESFVNSNLKFLSDRKIVS